MEPLTVPNDGWYIVTATDSTYSYWDFGDGTDHWIEVDAALLGISGKKEEPPPPDPFLNHYLE